LFGIDREQSFPNIFIKFNETFTVYDATLLAFLAVISEIIGCLDWDTQNWAFGPIWDCIAASKRLKFHPE